MTDIIAAILHRPMIEIAALAGILCVIIASAGVAIYLIFRGLSYLRIKKIGVTGIECATLEPSRRRVFGKKKEK